VKHTGTTATPFLYNGRDGVMTDANGLYYMRARYYNPEIKRFVNQDVLLGIIQEGQTLNRYAYVNGQPVSYIDPFGLAKIMTRPLSFLQPTYGLQSKYITPKLNVGLDYFNAEVAHEHIFFDDGKNIGWSEHGFFTDSKKGYTPSFISYNDNIMKLSAVVVARSVRENNTPYSLLGEWGPVEKYNCQDYISSVRDLYGKIYSYLKNAPKKVKPKVKELLQETEFLNEQLDRILTNETISPEEGSIIDEYNRYLFWSVEE